MPKDSEEFFRSLDRILRLTDTLHFNDTVSNRTVFSRIRVLRRSERCLRDSVVARLDGVLRDAHARGPADRLSRSSGDREKVRGREGPAPSGEDALVAAAAEAEGDRDPEAAR